MYGDWVVYCGDLVQEHKGAGTSEEGGNGGGNGSGRQVLVRVEVGGGAGEQTPGVGRVGEEHGGAALEGGYRRGWE